MMAFALAGALLLQAGSSVDPKGTAPAEPAAAIRRLINAGEPKKALELIRTLDPRQTETPAIQLLLGVAAYHAELLTGAIEALAPIVDGFPPDSPERREAEQVLGLSLFAMGRLPEAIPRLEATRRWAGDKFEILHALTRSYIYTRRVEPARATVAAMYGVAPDSAAARLLAAQDMIRVEMDSLAEMELEAARRAEPRLPQVHLLLGQIALFRGRLDDAVALTRAELDINPASATAWSQLGDAYVRMGSWEPAIAALRRSTWINPYYSAPFILLGRAYGKTEQPAVAESMFRRAIQLDPNNRMAHYSLAQLLQQAGRTDEASREFAIAERLVEPRRR